MAVDEHTDSQDAASETDTRTIIRDALILQGKLVIDGLRDAILIPLSFLAALVSLMQKGSDHGRFFYDVVRMGRRSERWIDLFAAADRVCPREEEAGNAAGLDAYLAQVETRLAREFGEGEVTSSARRAVDALVEKIRSARGSFRESDPKKQNH